MKHGFLRTFPRAGALAALLSLLAAPSRGLAQSPELEVASFDLNQAVELALRLNPEVLGVREKTEEFGQMVRQAKAEALPDVGLGLSVRQNRDPGLRNSPFFQRIVEGGDVPADALGAFFFTNYVWTFDVSQPIYTFGRVGNALEAARQEESGVDLDIEAVENRVSFDVVQACYGYLLALQNLTLLETENQARERQLEQVQARYELGDATRLDLLRARVTLANLKPEILAAQNDLQVAQASVNNTLGRPAGAPIEVRADLEVEDPPPEVLRPEALLELAGQYRPELRRFRVDRRVLDARIGVTSSEVKPQIRANGTFGINTFANENFTDLGLRTWAVGVSLDWKLFDGFRTASQVGALRSQRTQKEYDESTFRNALSVQLKEANGTWHRALESLEVTTLAVSEAREAERVAEESLRYGAATTLDVLQATLALRTSELNQMTAAHDALVALAQMKYLVGFRADAPDATITGGSPVAGVAAPAQGSQP